MARKIGFTASEARGVIYFFIIIAVVVGSKFYYDHIENRAALRLLNHLDIDYRDSVTRFEFDPNSVELPELMQMGLSKREAVNIIRYREAGKVFRIKEDLFTCYGISDSLYYSLEPYIVIADTFRFKPRAYTSYESASSSSVAYRSQQRYARELLAPSRFLVDTVSAEYLYAIGALSRRQAASFVKWRDLSGIYDMEEFCDCYVISDSIAAALEPYLIFSAPPESIVELIDINRADSVELRSVYGIGEKSVVAILAYREMLGGFYSVEQLSEIKVVTESNYEKIIKQILCDSCDISKIDVNFASAKTIKGHPYIADRALRRLLKVRELKGGWSTIEEMIDDDIFTQEEATRVRPYLLFEDYLLREASSDEFF
ncbi:MAG: helix-hairpin-helix domain-containing protein [Rikenellaceae bacterium]